MKNHHEGSPSFLVRLFLISTILISKGYEISDELCGQLNIGAGASDWTLDWFRHGLMILEKNSADYIPV